MKSDHDLPVAAVPAKNLSADESGEYNWLERHEQVKKETAKGQVDLIFLGDSITHYFGGSPKAKFIRGGKIWQHYYGHRHTVNMGFGRDRTQNVLWRLEHGAVDGINPKLAVLMIGVNNIVSGDAPQDVACGVKTICETLRRKLPRTDVLLLGILPFNPLPDNKSRMKVRRVNTIIAELGQKPHIHFLNIGGKFLATNGTISPDIMPDGLHPNDRGYQIFAGTIEQKISCLLKDNPVSY
ncbi:MAG: GDSL-type esterase/lipase family protein [Victivallales bacterium]|nr:GDSL-type esterase/lipase family protein [Victivallales bacterium]